MKNRTNVILLVIFIAFLAVVLPMLQKQLSEAFPDLTLQCASTSREPSHFV